jgi:branched-chain amino acid transport system permease protein
LTHSSDEAPASDAGAHPQTNFEPAEELAVASLMQSLIDGLGRGSVYALIALGIAVIFGVMHLVNFAHGELITISAYVSVFILVNSELSWWVAVPAIFVTSILASIAIEFVAFRWVRGQADFTMLLTSFGVHFVVQALFVMYVGASVQTFPRPPWIDRIWSVGGVNIAYIDMITLGVTAITLVATVLLLQRTMFGIALRAAAEDFDAARLMGVKSDQVIRRAFMLAGALAGIAAIFWLMRTGQARPTTGLNPMLKGVLAAIIGGLGSMQGAVLGGFLLGLSEVLLRSWLPESIVGITDGVVFGLIALFFIFRPGGLISVVNAERV